MIASVLETQSAVKCIKKWGLEGQYVKAKRNIISHSVSGNRLKLRQPKAKGVYYFRISKQYRALARRKGDTLIVFAIDNHS